jgi:hemoglobin-like flavoprotein
MADESPGDGSSFPSPPDEAVCAAVRSTCLRLYAAETVFVASFRASLVDLVPELRRTTADHGSTVAENLARAVLWAALTTDRHEVVEETFQNVGAEHSRRGFPVAGYHGAGHALLRAARNAHLGDWTSELSSAWVAYYGWLAAHLAEGARRGAGSPVVPAFPTGPPPSASPPLDTGPSPATRPPPATGPPTSGVLLPVPLAPAPPSQLLSASPGPPGAVADRSPERGQPDSLDEVLELLRARYFAGNERALGAIVTRVALRTGVDLRAPRPDQRTNPAVIANVVAVLQVMGYVLRADPAEQTAPGVQAPAQRTRTRWWRRRRSSSSGDTATNWGQSLPGTSR